MSDRSIARRYASALYEEAAAGEQPDRAAEPSAATVQRVDADVELLATTLAGSRDLQLLLTSPVVGSDKKETILRRLFESSVSEIVMRFVLLVNNKGRGSMLADILDGYSALRLDQQGIVTAHARVAVKMGSDEEEELRESIAKTLGREIRLEVEEDSSLIGGLVVRIGDRVYDGSLKRQLAVLQKQLEGNSHHSN